MWIRLQAYLLHADTPPESRESFCLAACQPPRQSSDLRRSPASPLWRRLHVEVVVTCLAGATTVGPCAAGDFTRSPLGLRVRVACETTTTTSETVT